MIIVIVIETREGQLYRGHYVRSEKPETSRNTKKISSTPSLEQVTGVTDQDKLSIRNERYKSPGNFTSDSKVTKHI